MTTYTEFTVAPARWLPLLADGQLGAHLFVALLYKILLNNTCKSSCLYQGKDD